MEDTGRLIGVLALLGLVGGLALLGRGLRALRALFAVVERYPQVRSQENVLRLQAEIERPEGQLADRRELYNDQVFRHNTAIAQLPAIVLAALLRWKSRPFFDAGEGAGLAPDVSLDAREAGSVR